MTLEKWLVQPGQTRVIDIDDVRKLKIALLAGQVDVIAHDEPTTRVEVHAVTGKELRVEITGDVVEIDHAQLRAKWDNIIDVFRNFGGGGPKAEVSVSVPRGVALTLGVASASALVSGMAADAKLNTVSGDVIVDGLTGDLSVNAVSGDVQVRDLDGTLGVNSVSGDVAATGSIRKTTVDTVSGAMLVDTTGVVDRVSLNTVSGTGTVRLDDGMPASYVVRSVSGRVLVDGVVRSGSGTTSYTGTTGDLGGRYADVHANSVSGDVTVLRRPAPAPHHEGDDL